MRQLNDSILKGQSLTVTPLPEDFWPTKGADSEMLSRIDFKKNGVKDLEEIVKKDL